MSKLLNIQASPRGERSYSISAADAFVKSYRQANPAHEIVTLNLFTKELPPFAGLALQAKYTILHGLDHSEEELAAWRSVEDTIAEVKSADKYVMAVPMWPTRKSRPPLSRLKKWPNSFRLLTRIALHLAFVRVCTLERRRPRLFCCPRGSFGLG